jgi:hypothetical protein
MHEQCMSKISPYLGGDLDGAVDVGGRIDTCVCQQQQDERRVRILARNLSVSHGGKLTLSQNTPIPNNNTKYEMILKKPTISSPTLRNISTRAYLDYSVIVHVRFASAVVNEKPKDACVVILARQTHRKIFSRRRIDTRIAEQDADNLEMSLAET